MVLCRAFAVVRVGRALPERVERPSSFRKGADNSARSSRRSNGRPPLAEMAVAGLTKLRERQGPELERRKTIPAEMRPASSQQPLTAVNEHRRAGNVRCIGAEKETNDLGNVGCSTGLAIGQGNAALRP